jgi:hypothetical protein
VRQQCCQAKAAQQLARQAKQKLARQHHAQSVQQLQQQPPVVSPSCSGKHHPQQVITT